MKENSRGFSLIELMVVVAIIGILATIAVPSYKQYVIRAQRKEAMAALQGLAQWMERYSAEHSNSYLDASAGNNGAPTGFPATSPTDGGTATYNLTATIPNASEYTLRATPIPGSTQASDGKIELDSTGARRWDRNNNGSFADANENNWNDH